MFWYKQIAANTFFQIVARVISSGASFLITLLVARHFGLVGYGDFAKVTSFVTNQAKLFSLCANHEAHLQA